MKISIIRKLILLLFVSIPLSLASHSVGSEETLLDLIDSLESDSKKNSTLNLLTNYILNQYLKRLMRLTLNL